MIIFAKNRDNNMNAQINKELIRVGKKLTRPQKMEIMVACGIKSETSMNKYMDGGGAQLATGKMILIEAQKILSRVESI